MAGRNFLFVPGPTNTPDRILRAMHVAMEDHRSSDFPKLAAPVLQDLKKIFKTTTGQAYIFPASGTGAWEASLSNTLSPGDRVIAARFGQFSHLWIDMAQRLGLRVDVLDAEWGEGAPIERYQRSEEHTSELQSLTNLVCRLLLEKKKKTITHTTPHTHHRSHVHRPH